jgi:hypothetical protein
MKDRLPFKKIGIIIFIIIVIILSLLGLLYPQILAWLNFIILIATLGALLVYVYDTNRIANQTQETNLRPVILRSGYIHKWEDIKFEYDKDGNIISGKPLQFTVLKNIAKDIKGEIILNGYRHELLFGNDISKTDTGSTWLSTSWGWMKQDSVIYAVFLEKEKKKTKENNKIYIEYKDIENNQYYTTEDEDFHQESLSK